MQKVDRLVTTRVAFFNKDHVLCKACSFGELFLFPARSCNLMCLWAADAGLLAHQVIGRVTLPGGPSCFAGLPIQTQQAQQNHMHTVQSFGLSIALSDSQ
jgi:hypothetical protein